MIKSRGRLAKAASQEEEARKELMPEDPPNVIRQRKADERSAQNVTESLMELRHAMASQIQQSDDTMHMLLTSSRKIEKTKDEMADMGSSVRTSQRLLAKYDRRELTDKLLIIAGLALFFGVVLYILKKRLLGWIW
ncbi:hypothetical protein EMCRGX_G029594 [Ephydatia muelleri]|eukprot:Em0013g167a